MGVQVDVFTWPVITVSPGAQVDLVHWLVDNDGASLIDPDHWCWMSAVPEFAGARPDRPVPSAAIRIAAQGAVRDGVDEPGLNNTNWFVTWFNPGDETTTFTPRMTMAPSR